ncbi:MAG: L-serine deaminase, partial [Flavobacteriaceae bacterium]
QADILRNAAQAFREIDVAAIALQITDKSAIADVVTQTRVNVMKQWRKKQNFNG